MVKAKAFYYVDDVQRLLGASMSKCYKVIQDLNKELKAQGFIIVPGRVPKKYFEERFYCDGDTIADQLAAPEGGDTVGVQ